MAGYTSKILNTAISALNAQQALIGVTANNIANVNTPNYVKRGLSLQARSASDVAGGVNLGNGVDIGDITRQTNAYLERILRQAAGNYQSAEVQDGYLDRVQALFPMDGATTTIGSAMNAFFAAAQDLAVNPANIELRANFITRGQELTSIIRDTYNSLAGLQSEADERIATELQTVNALTAQIAEVNGQIRAGESTGRVAADERDQRDALLQKLSEKMDFTLTELPDGTVNITLPNGFAIVAGEDSRALTFTQNPSFITPPATAPKSLSGGVLGYIVYDYSEGAGTSEIDLTGMIADGGGSLSGLLQVRGVYPPAAASPFEASGVLVDVAKRIEGIAHDLLTAMNAANLGPDRSGGGPVYVPSSGDLDGDLPPGFGLFSLDGGITDTNNYPDEADLTAYMTAHGTSNLASRLTFALTNARDVAAARIHADGNFYPGDGGNMEALAAEQDKVRIFNPSLFSGNYAQAYDDMVTRIGNAKNVTKVSLSVADSNLIAAQNQRDEVSGVSLDEEFTNLIKYQQAYQAAARLIKVADALMQEVVSVI